MFTKGTKVTIKPEYQDEGDDVFTWECLDDESKGRVMISPIDHSMTIKPVYVVCVSWIDVVQDN
jgi:hypothetical protein